MAPRPPPARDRNAIAGLRRALREAGYEAPLIQEALGTGGDLVAVTSELPVYRRRLSDDGFGVLVRLFLLETHADRDVAERALSTPLLEALLDAGVLEHQDGIVRGAVRIVPHDDLLIASDRHDRDAGAELVAGVHRPSSTLANLTVRLSVERALDLCTGCGIQALLAARHATTVVATDVNERALAFAAFNAELNEVDNVELRRGSFLEPVTGERFELVTCNPPYVVSPESEVLFRDGGLPRDAVSELVIRGVPALLEEGGFATIMASWVQEGDDPSARPLSWLEGSQCDALVLHSGTEDPLTAAALWNRDSAVDEERYDARLARWVDYFDAEGITAIAYGAVILRRRMASPNWSGRLPLPRRPEPASAHLKRIVRGHDVLAGIRDVTGLRRLQPALASTAVVEQRLRRVEGGILPTEASVRVEDGLGYSAGLDQTAAALVLALDGTKPLGELIAGVELALGLEAGTLEEAGIRLARMLFELGFADPQVPAD